MSTSTRSPLPPADPEAERSPAQQSPEKDGHEKEKPLARSAAATLLRTSRTQGRRCAAWNLFLPSSTGPSTPKFVHSYSVARTMAMKVDKVLERLPGRKKKMTVILNVKPGEMFLGFLPNE
ncbi:uncharacterized protein LOC119335726 [Triticum dicoccoides]|uniref:uncharacterized protein LOC119335726 n=1 Tax=Triticum dicoccoides TaxID=85692 RepID=UPI0018919A94|nr:uncharacterized protein LOC119335726 [Triticum dicoccoides]